MIDHAWGIEPCTIKHIKNYKSQAKSLGSGQVLHCAYSVQNARTIVKEMTERLVLDLLEKKAPQLPKDKKELQKLIASMQRYGFSLSQIKRAIAMKR